LAIVGVYQSRECVDIDATFLVSLFPLAITCWITLRGRSTAFEFRTDAREVDCRVAVDRTVGFDCGVVAEFGKLIQKIGRFFVYQRLTTGQDDVLGVLVALDLVDDVIDCEPRSLRFPGTVVRITEPAPEVASRRSDEHRWDAR
jgi:hypothetical protein